MTIKDRVIDEAKKGNIITSGFGGLMSGSLEELIDQPVEGILYDLNRDPATILTFIEDPKWVNDYACMLVITALKKRVDELEELNSKLK